MTITHHSLTHVVARLYLPTHHAATVSNRERHVCVRSKLLYDQRAAQMGLSLPLSGKLSRLMAQSAGF
jgi:hypothetical protein